MVTVAAGIPLVTSFCPKAAGLPKKTVKTQKCPAHFFTRIKKSTHQRNNLVDKEKGNLQKKGNS